MKNVFHILLLFLLAQGWSLASICDVGWSLRRTGKLFDKIIPNGQKAKSFLFDYADKVQYYHGIDNGVQYFYKIAEDNYGVVIAIDAITKVIIDAECRVIVNESDIFFENLIMEDNNNDD